jgi:hypothetical protein
VPWLGHEVSQLTTLRSLGIHHIDELAEPLAQYGRLVLEACFAFRSSQRCTCSAQTYASTLS